MNYFRCRQVVRRMQQLKFIQKHYRQILPMALLIAWFWCFPLFGPIQVLIPVPESLHVSFSLFFLLGMVLGHLAMAGPFSTRISKRFPITCFSLLLAGMGIMLIGIGERFLVSALPLIMGLAGGAYFVYWGTGIYDLPSNEKGRYMGLMMAMASVFQTVILYSYGTWPHLGLWMVSMLLLFSLLTSTWFTLSEDPLSIEAHPKKVSALKPFWIPFALLLLCYYILSWITHNSFYPYLMESTDTSVFWGPFFYGATAWLAGCFLDRKKHVNHLAIIGLVILGCTFLMLSLGSSFQRKLPLHLFFESSYAFFDLFVWVSLAVVAARFYLSPRRSYAVGLSVNGLMVLLGVVLHVLLGDVVGTATIYMLAALAGIVLFIGVIPAHGLEKMTLVTRDDDHGQRLKETIKEEVEEIIAVKEGLPEKLTSREKEVLYLMLKGLSNAEIEQEIKITKNTLKTHIRNIYGKTEVGNRSELKIKMHMLIQENGDAKKGERQQKK